MEPRRIFIVEDDVKLMELVGRHLARYGYQIVQVQNLQRVDVEVRQANPDLILLDINLPHYDGFYWCRQFRLFTKAPIIFLSARDGDMDQVMALEFGADDYVTKPFHPDVILAKIRALLRRAYGEYALEETRSESRVMRFGSLTIDLGRAELRFGDRQTLLTRTELQLLDRLLAAQGEVVVRDSLLATLWDESDFVDDNTLTVNVARLRKKLEDMGLPDAIVTVRGLGYRWALPIGMPRGGDPL